MRWALIAGGSRGIGYSIAEALAKRSYNILLVARNQEELDTAKSGLEKTFHIQVEILSCDLSLTEAASIIFDYCIAKNLEINVLCNAAGTGGSMDFPELPLSELRSMIRLNFESAVALSYIFLPVLKQTAPSYILNVGSMAGFAPIAIKNVYSSTKAALHSFSYSVSYLFKKNNISVSCVCPGPVFTKPSIEVETIKQLGWAGKQMAVASAMVGEYAIRGMFKRKMIIVPGRLAAVFSFLLRILPNRLTAYLLYTFGKQNHL